MVPAARGAYDASVSTAEYLVPVAVALTPNPSSPASLARGNNHKAMGYKIRGTWKPFSGWVVHEEFGDPLAEAAHAPKYFSDAL